MKFFERYSENHPLLKDFCPIITYRVSDKIRFRGRKVSYEDFTSFVFCDTYWKPFIFATEEEIATGRKVNLISVMSAGLAELLRFDKLFDDDTVDLFQDELYQSVNIDIHDAIRMMKYISEIDRTGESQFSADYIIKGISMRRTYATTDMQQVNALVSQLCVLSVLDFKTWVDVLFQVMRVSLGYLAPWVEDAENIIGEGSGTELECAVIENQSLYDVNKAGKVGYKIPGTRETRYISDARGFGIRLCALYYCYLMDEFAESASSACLSKLYNVKTLEGKITSRMNASLGDDFFARWVKGRSVKMFLCDEYAMTDRRITYQLDKGYYTLSNGEIILREVYENEYLYRHAFGMKFSNNLLGVSMSYFNLKTLVESIGLLLGFSDEANFKNYMDTELRKQKELNKEKGVTTSQIADLNDKIASLNHELQKLNNTLESERKEHDLAEQGLMSQLSDLQHQLASKSDIISKKDLEIEELRTQCEFTYTEDELDVVEDTVSIEEMVEYLKDFKILHLGGRTNLLDKLSALGLNNGSQILNVSELAGRPSCDFMCTHTRFVAHRIVTKALANRSDGREIMFYFNGINEEQFVRAYYDFVKRYLEDE